MAQKKLAREMKHYIANFSKEAEELYRVTFPQKVLELNALMLKFQETGILQLSTMSLEQPEGDAPTDSTPKTPPRATGTAEMDHASLEQPDDDAPTDSTPRTPPRATGTAEMDHASQTCHAALREVMDAVKPLYAEGQRHGITIRSWIHFLGPRSTDENSVLEGARDLVMREARFLREGCEDGLTDIGTFYEKRAKLISKVLKHPRVRDYRVAVRELDDRMSAGLGYQLHCMADGYARLFNALSKNIDTIKSQSGDSEGHMTS